MSLINLFVAAKAAIAERRRRQRAYAELMALDDHSLADIGIHRSQIPALVAGVEPAGLPHAEPDPVVSSVFGYSPTRLVSNRHALDLIPF